MRFSRAARRTGAAGLAALPLVLAGCGQVGNPLEAFGASIPPPDEFQVIAYEPPVVPGEYTLPEPTPGAPSPRAPEPGRAAVEALLGPGATTAAAAEPSAGEQALLGAADAASASSAIRVQLEEDKRQAAASEPYEPPTIWELFGFGGDGERIDETQLIDPVTEGERLQSAGVAAPVDPAAAARAPESEEPRPAPEPIDRRPTNRIGPPPTPAY
jgi:hypothetical protein